MFNKQLSFDLSVRLNFDLGKSFEKTRNEFVYKAGTYSNSYVVQCYNELIYKKNVTTRKYQMRFFQNCF